MEVPSSHLDAEGLGLDSRMEPSTRRIGALEFEGGPGLEEKAPAAVGQNRGGSLLGKFNPMRRRASAKQHARGRQLVALASERSGGLWDLRFDGGWLGRNGLDLLNADQRESFVTDMHRSVEEGFKQDDAAEQESRAYLRRITLPPLKWSEERKAGGAGDDDDGCDPIQREKQTFDWGPKAAVTDAVDGGGDDDVGGGDFGIPGKRRRRRRRRRRGGNKVAPTGGEGEGGGDGDEDEDEDDEEEPKVFKVDFAGAASHAKVGAEVSRHVEQHNGDTLWVAHIDEETGVPVYINSLTDQRTFEAPDVGFRWLADHEVQEDPEGLGLDFEDTPWVTPSYDKALQHRRASIFKHGKGRWCMTTSEELGQMGEGIHLYFMFLKVLGTAAFVSTLIYIPTLGLAAHGSAIPPFGMDLLRFAHLTIGNIGPLLADCMDVYHRDIKCEAALNETHVTIFNSTYTAGGVGMLVSGCDLAVTVVFVLAGFYFQLQLRLVVRHAKQDFVTSRDYAVKVLGAPPTVEPTELCDHFSRLFAVDDLPDRVGSHALSSGDKLRPVTDVSNSDDMDYVKSWVAESAVATVHNCHSVRRHQQITTAARNVQRCRANIKRLRSPEVSGPETPEKRIKAAYDALFKATQRLDRARKLQVSGRANGDDAVAAFVTFNHMESAHRCVSAYRFSHRFPLLCKCFQPTRLRVDGKHILNVERAPAPTDILWENLDLRNSSRCLRKLFTSLVGTAVLVLCFASIVGFNSFGNWFQGEFADTGACEWDIPATFHGRPTPQPGDEFGNKFAELAPDPGFDGLCRARFDGALALTYTGGNAVGISIEAKYSMEACDFKLNSTATAAATAAAAAAAAEAEVNGTTAAKEAATAAGVTVTGLACPDPRAATQCPCVNRSATGTTALGSVVSDAHKQGASCATTGCVAAGENGTVCEDAFPENALLLCFCSQNFIRAVEYTVGIAAWPNATPGDAHPCRTIGGFYIAATLLDLSGDIVINIVNLILGFTVGWFAVNVERHSSLSQQTVNVAYKTFIFMVINTAVIELVTKGTTPFDAPRPLLIPGLFAGDHKDFTRSWHAKAGGAMTTTMLVEALLGHLFTLADILVYWPCRRCRVRRSTERRGAGGHVMQADINDELAAPEFDVSGRFAAILNTLMITLIYCGGLPALMPIAAVSFFLSYWMDKWLLLRYCVKPVALDARLLFMGLNQLYVAIVFHLAFAIWMLGSEGVLYSTRPYKGTDAPATGDDFWGTIVARMSRSNTLPHAVALATFGFIFLAGRLFRNVIDIAFTLAFQRCVCANHRQKPLPKRIPTAPFTESFCRDVRRNKRGRSLPLSVTQKKNGWKRVVVDDWQVRVKLWTTGGESHSKGDRKLTWEVIEETDVYSYHLDRNPRYHAAVMAHEEGLRQRNRALSTTGEGVANAAVHLERRLSRARSKLVERKASGVGAVLGNTGGVGSSSGAAGTAPREAGGAGRAQVAIRRKKARPFGIGKFLSIKRKDAGKAHGSADSPPP